MLIGLHLHASGRKIWITWEAAGYTSDTCFVGGRPGVGAAVSRFKPVKWEQSHQPGVLVRPGRKPPSVTGWTSRSSGNICEDHGSNAEHQDATGWPSNRQQLRQGDAWNGCGQKCIGSGVLVVEIPELIERPLDLHYPPATRAGGTIPTCRVTAAFRFVLRIIARCGFGMNNWTTGYRCLRTEHATAAICQVTPDGGSRADIWLKAHHCASVIACSDLPGIVTLDSDRDYSSATSRTVEVAMREV